MDEAALTSGFRASAILANASHAGAGAYIARKGDETAGALFIKVIIGRVGYVLAQQRNMAGEKIFAHICPKAHEDFVAPCPFPVAAEPELDAFLARQIGYDSDLWIIEIEDIKGRHFADLPVAPLSAR